jgi:tripartite-type tricarboxylate transporter receptor subunit TctC
MHSWLLALSTTFIVLASLGGRPAEAQSFFEGKTVRVIVGLAPGGGFDTYARVIARHMSKHVPGNPTFVVENMTGAGSLIAANHIYSVAGRPHDQQVQRISHAGSGLGAGRSRFDARRFSSSARR